MLGLRLWVSDDNRTAYANGTPVWRRGAFGSAGASPFQGGTLRALVTENRHSNAEHALLLSTLFHLLSIRR